VSRVRARAIAALCLAAAALAGAQPAAPAREAPAWPDTVDARVQALALVQTLNAEILGSRSATATLERWCRDYRLAADPRIVAVRAPGPARPPARDQRQRLQVNEGDEVKHRRVRLRCGELVLSEADLWYVPARLTPQMNGLLESTDTPFGRAVQTLEPYRQTFDAVVLWTPLPAGWALLDGPRPAVTGGPLAIPDALFRHRAVLYTRDHLPIAEVDEVYQRQILSFEARRPD
jgi:hypothetical protein